MMLAAQVAPQRRLQQQQPIVDLENKMEQRLWCGAFTMPLICELAARIITAPAFHILTFVAVGVGLGFLAKKVCIHYTASRPIVETLLTWSTRVTVLKVIVLAVSIVASYLFPVIAAAGAITVGFISGFSYWAKRKR